MEPQTPSSLNLPPNNPIRQWYTSVSEGTITPAQAAHEAKTNLGPVILPYTLEWLTDSNTAVVTAARKTLQAFEFQGEPDFLPQLLQTIKKQAANIKRAREVQENEPILLLIEGLKYHDAPSARQTLLKLLDHPNDAISAKAVETLTHSHDEDALKPLFSALFKKGALDKLNEKRQRLMMVSLLFTSLLMPIPVLHFTESTFLADLTTSMSLLFWFWFRGVWMHQKTALKSFVHTFFLLVLAGLLTKISLLIPNLTLFNSFHSWLFACCFINSMESPIERFLQYDKNLSNALSQFKDPRALGTMAVAAQDSGLQQTIVVARTLAGLLDQITEDLPYQLPPEQMRALLKLSQDQSEWFVLKLIDKLKYIGDESALEKLRSLARSSKTSPEIAQKAQATIPQLEQRVERLKETRVLLRAPSESSERENLLRAHSHTSDPAEQEQLLRPKPQP